MASHRAVEQKLGQDLSIAPLARQYLVRRAASDWEEFDWLGRDIRIGEAVLRVRERITRCLATTVNPDTGERDADTLGALKQLGSSGFRR